MRFPEGGRVGSGPVDSALVDWWSLVHALAGIVVAFLVPPFWALVVVVLWEPLELLVLSPLLDRRGIAFANETLANSLMDVVFDAIGVLLGVYLLRPLLGVPDLWSMLWG